MTSLRTLAITLGIGLAAACTSGTGTTAQKIECSSGGGSLTCHPVADDTAPSTDPATCQDIDEDGDGLPSDDGNDDLDDDGASNADDADDDDDGVADSADADDDDDGIDDDHDCDSRDGGDEGPDDHGTDNPPA